jgi:type III pantothenate kinase
MKEESGFDNATVVATGGLGKMIYEETDCIDFFDANLTLKGLQLIYDKQR